MILISSLPPPGYRWTALSSRDKHFVYFVVCWHYLAIWSLFFPGSDMSCVAGLARIPREPGKHRCKFFCGEYSFQLWQCLNSIDNFSVSTFQGEFKFHKMKAMQDVHLCMYVCMYGGCNLKVGWNIVCMCVCMYVCMYTCVYVCMFHKVTFDWCLSQLVVAVRLWSRNDQFCSIRSIRRNGVRFRN